MSATQVAFENNVGMDIGIATQIDLSSSQFYFGLLNSTGLITVAGAGQHALGVIQDGPVGTVSIPKNCTIRYGGITKIVCGGTFVAGDYLSSDASGRAVKYTGATVFTGTPYILSGSAILGQALAPGALTSPVSLSTMIVNPMGYAA